MTGDKSRKESNGEAKLHVMNSFFEDFLERRAGFLPHLNEGGHTEEALLLCCCYIEGLGSAIYWPGEGSNKSFVRVLREYGGEEALWHIHPKQLRIGLREARSRKVKSIANKIEAELVHAGDTIYSEDEILDRLQPCLTPAERETLRQHVWRGTLAALAYSHIRSRLVHELVGTDAIVLGGTTLKGKPVSAIDFHMLYPALLRVVEVVRHVSLATEKWFGHDFKENVEPHVAAQV